jgi:hypothetical protein
LVQRAVTSAGHVAELARLLRFLAGDGRVEARRIFLYGVVGAEHRRREHRRKPEEGGSNLHGSQMRRNWTIPSWSVNVLTGHFSLAAAVAIGMSAVVAVVGTGRRRVVASFRSVGAAVSVGPADGIVVVVLGGSATRRGGASTSAGELAAGTDLTGS